MYQRSHRYFDDYPVRAGGGHAEDLSGLPGILRRLYPFIAL